ncbi:MAG: PIG-L family deacetylase [Anaerolineae bacterium]|nr:PIG-L family deacetylase [Anaerolineae bacterium]
MKNTFPNPERVLVICAHPDDPEFGAAGSVACWAQGGAEVTYIIVTDGSKGSADPEMTREQLVKLRQAEQRAAAETLGVANVVFLGHPDGEVYNTPELREDIVRQIRRYRPDVLVTHDPTARIIANSYINHPDHRAVGDTVLDAVFPLARDRLNFPQHEAEGLKPHNVTDIFLLFTNEPNFWVDISPTIDKKVAALVCHTSQIGEPEELEERIREGAKERAAKVSFDYAEHFRRVRLPR